MEYKQSLAGFHNPYKHKGLTPEKFLTLYVYRLKSMSKKKDGFNRLKLVSWIEAHWESQLVFVSKLFPKTLDVKPKVNPHGLLGHSVLALKRNAFKLRLPKQRQLTIKNWEIDKYLHQLGEI